MHFVLSFLLEALFGVAPFASDTLEELHLKVLEEAPILVITVLNSYNSLYYIFIVLDSSSTRDIVTMSTNIGGIITTRSSL